MAPSGGGYAQAPVGKRSNASIEANQSIVFKFKEDMLPVQSLAEITLLDQSPVVATLHPHPHPPATALAQHQVVTMLAQHQVVTTLAQPLDQSRHPLAIALAPLPDPPLDQPHLTQDNMMLAIR